MLFRDYASAGALALALPRPASATLLYVSSYIGTITTLNLTLPGDNATRASLDLVSSSDGCAPNPSWLTLDSPNGILYCTDEQLDWQATNGSLSSFQTHDDGFLLLLDKVDTIKGPVSAVLYGENATGLALAHYTGSSLSSYAVSKPDALTPVQAETWTLPHPGPDPSRQEAPHPHEALVDPTGHFILVPDLGADLVRIFLVDQTTLAWTPVAPLEVPSGSGPRHAAFLVTNEKTYFYLVTELANTILGYELSYNDNQTLSFSQVYESNTYGEGETAPSGATAAEIHLSPDDNYLIVSSRGEGGSLTIPNFDPSNSTEIPSDSLISFSVDHQTGNLTKVQRFPAGGVGPRQFSINRDGSLLGVGLQADSRVVVISRDTETGLLKDFVAHATVEGEVTAVIFDE